VRLNLGTEALGPGLRRGDEIERDRIGRRLAVETIQQAVAFVVQSVLDKYDGKS
jgi:hypothetical protein